MSINSINEDIFFIDVENTVQIPNFFFKKTKKSNSIKKMIDDLKKNEKNTTFMTSICETRLRIFMKQLMKRNFKTQKRTFCEIFVVFLENAAYECKIKKT